MDGDTVEAAMNYICRASKLQPYNYVIADGEMENIDFNKLPLSIITNDSVRSLPGKYSIIFFVL